MTDRPDQYLDPADEPGPPEPGPPARSRRRRGPGATEVIGNAIVGFDYAIFRSTKPPSILVEAAKPVRGLSGTTWPSRRLRVWRRRTAPANLDQRR